VNAFKYILAKQIEWAKNQHIDLIGSKGGRGRKVYTSALEENLFQPLNPFTREELVAGDGSELNGGNKRPAKIQALHSSSALAINHFDYWRPFPDISIIVSACKLARPSSLFGSIQFEQKFPIDKRFKFAPNLDVVLYPENHKSIKAYAIESKFTEPYSSRGHGGIDKKYLDNSTIWDNLSAIKLLAQKICPDDMEFAYLHAGQLIKHILGLNRKFGHGNYRLLYLWYDTVGVQGGKHQREIEQFSKIALSDGVKFHSITYQELIINIAKYREQHGKYVKYLTQRYL